MSRKKDPFHGRWYSRDGGRHEDEYDIYEDEFEYDEDAEDDEFEIEDMQDDYEKGSNNPRPRPAPPLPPFPSTTRNSYPRKSRTSRMPESRIPKPPIRPTQTTRPKQKAVLPDESSRDFTGSYQRPSRQRRRTDDLSEQTNDLRPVASKPRKRRVWPIFLVGCVSGAISVVLALAIIVVLGIHSIQNQINNHTSGNNNDNSLIAQPTPDSKTVPLPAISQIIVCDLSGNISVQYDQSVTSPTVTTTKKVHAADQNAANPIFNKISVEVQPPDTLTKPLTCGSTQLATNSTTLTINVTFPSDLKNQTDEAVDVTIKLPQSIVQNTITPLQRIAIKASNGDINVKGISSVMTLNGGTFTNITVQGGELFSGSTLSTSDGNMIFNGLLNTTSSDSNPAYYNFNGGHQIDITITPPEDINTYIFLNTTTNAGKLFDDFFSPNDNNGKANYTGPLNPAVTKTQPKVDLNLLTSTGDIKIHKGTTS